MRLSQSSCLIIVLIPALAGFFAGCSRESATEERETKPFTHEERMSEEPTEAKPNRLIHELSPYLLQHAHNPVDWYPWGEEAFNKAKTENKPIFLSIGYSTCHWCHVMERESFENPEIAALMNEGFISIKVDREEMPDVDHVYMNAVMMLTGRGGWPLTAILTPELKPFYGGTYFPPDQRMGMPGMKQLLPSLAGAWKEKRSEVLSSAESITNAIQKQMVPEKVEAVLDQSTLEAAFQFASRTFDPSHGGFGDAPKFPRSHELSFLMGYGSRTKNEQVLKLATETLKHLRFGGIHDHLGGGFHRYSTDAQWLVPHFEKMLYDQALLVRAYLEAYRLTQDTVYADTARDILDYVLRDMTDPQGAFYAAEDADSEGEEGLFYVWKPAEIQEILGAETAKTFNAFYGVSPEGNFEGGTSILNITPPKDAAAAQAIEEKVKRLSQARQRLLAFRAKRIRPYRDDKILTSWNGLMIASFAYAASTLDEPRYLEAARKAADFIQETLIQDGALLRRYREGNAQYEGTLEDYAFLAYGFMELYEAGFEPKDLKRTQWLLAQMVERFWDEERGAFFFRDHQQKPLIASAQEVYDGALPSGNSVAAFVLLRVGRLTADGDLEAKGRRVLERFAGPVARNPFSYTQLLQALDFAIGPTQEIVIAGKRGDPSTERLLKVLRGRFLPRAVIAFHPTGEGREAIEALVPYVRSQNPIRGEAAAYVCENYICNLPVTDPERLMELLK